jgi:hypothetical protein
MANSFLSSKPNLDSKEETNESRGLFRFSLGFYFLKSWVGLDVYVKRDIVL